MNPRLRILVALVCGAGLAFLAWALFSTGNGELDVYDPGEEDAPSVSRDGAGDGSALSSSSSGSGSGARAARRDAEGDADADDLPADALRAASIRFVDADTGAALAGVRIYDQRSKRGFGPTDDSGELRLSGVSPQYLVAWGDGVLARPLDEPARQAWIAGEAARVALYRDRFTLRRALRFEVEEGMSQPARGALHIRVAPSSSSPTRPEMGGFPTIRGGVERSVSADLQTAWRAHVRQQIALPRHTVVLRSGPRMLPWRGVLAGLALRFCEARRYRVRVYADDGRVGEREVNVTARDTSPIVLRMTRGASIEVRVVGAGSRALPDAVVTLRHPGTHSEAERSARSDARGVARFSGLVAGDAIELRANARGYAGGKSLRMRVRDGAKGKLELRSVPMRTHRLTIREIKSNEAIGAAELFLGHPSVRGAIARSSDNGVANLPLQIGENAVLTVRKEGFGEHREILTVKAGVSLPSFVALVPDDRDRQLELGLVARIAGRVLRDGRPQKGVRVRLMAARDRNGRVLADSMEEGLLRMHTPGAKVRAILEGQRVRPQLEAATDDSGAFVLWPASRGRATLQAYVTGVAKRDVRVVLGSRQEIELK